MPPMLAIQIQLQHLEKQDTIIEPYHKNNIWHCKEQKSFWASNLWELVECS